MPSIPYPPRPIDHDPDPTADAPGGTDLEEQLLNQADSTAGGHRTHEPRELLEHLEDDLAGVDGVRFPTARSHVTPAPYAPRDHPAVVYRREPRSDPDATLEFSRSAAAEHEDVGFGTHVGPDQDDPRTFPMAVPMRHLVTVGRFRVAGTGVTDAGGNATLELTPGQWGGNVGQGAGVQQNQVWIIDRLVARAGAAGTVLVYAGAVGNDQDLVAALTLAGVSFAAQVDGNPVQLNPGWRVAAVIAGGGATLPCNVVAYYRLCEWREGGPEDDLL